MPIIVKIRIDQPTQAINDEIKEILIRDATPTAAGGMSAADKKKLDGIATTHDESGNIDFDGTPDVFTKDAVFAQPFVGPPFTYAAICTPYTPNDDGMITANVIAKYADRMTIRVSAAFQGTVAWRAGEVST